MMEQTLKDLFIKYSMSSLTSNDNNNSIFGWGNNDKMNFCYNNIQSAFVQGLYEGQLPLLDLTGFVEDSIEVFDKMGIKNITGDYKIYVDDGNVLVIEGGKITIK